MSPNEEVHFHIKSLVNSSTSKIHLDGCHGENTSWWGFCNFHSPFLCWCWCWIEKKILRCEQRARLGFHTLGKKPDCKVLYFLFSLFSILMLDGRKFPDASSGSGEEGKMELILTTALVNKTCQKYFQMFMYFFSFLFFACFWYCQPHSSTRLVKIVILAQPK